MLLASGPVALPILRLSLGEARHVLRTARAVLLDLDGTLIRGREAIQGAAAFLERHASRVVILTNNSTDTPESLCRSLRARGLRAEEGRTVLAGVQAVDAVAEGWPGRRVLMVAGEQLKEYARVRGLVLCQQGANVVLVARDERFDYAALSLAANAVQQGACFVAANPDLTHPGPGNSLVPETGSLVRAIAAAAGKEPDLIVGKPQSVLFHSALERIGAPPEEALMIGDNPLTDGEGAARIGMRHVIVGPQGGMTIADLLET